MPHGNSRGSRSIYDPPPSAKFPSACLCMQPHVIVASPNGRRSLDTVVLHMCTACREHTLPQRQYIDAVPTGKANKIGRRCRRVICAGDRASQRLSRVPWRLRAASPAVLTLRAAAAEIMLPSLCCHCCASCCCFSASAFRRACSSRHRCCHQTSDLYRSPAPSWPAPTQQPPFVHGTGCNPLSAMAPAMLGPRLTVVQTLLPCPMQLGDKAVA